MQNCLAFRDSLIIRSPTTYSTELQVAYPIVTQKDMATPTFRRLFHKNASSGKTLQCFSSDTFHSRETFRSLHRCESSIGPDSRLVEKQEFSLLVPPLPEWVNQIYPATVERMVFNYPHDLSSGKRHSRLFRSLTLWFVSPAAPALASVAVVAAASAAAFLDL